MSELIHSQTSAIERRLSRSLSSTRILAQGVRKNGGMISQFDTYAKEVLESIGGVSNLQLAPDGVIRKIYPLKGNEKAIGHNILADDHRLKEALLAIADHRLTLAGPFTLIQGGIAIIGRNPIYLPHKEGETFWGFATAVIYLKDLIDSTELESLEERGYSYQLRRIHPDTGDNKVFYRSTRPLTEDNYTGTIHVPNATWTLAISLSDTKTNWYISFSYIVSVLAALLIAWMVSYVLKQPAKLKQIVNEKTYQLEQLSYHDYLTSLANRRYFVEKLEDLLATRIHNNNLAALMYLDLNNFKKINDSMGHNSGDYLLQQLAVRLKECVGPADIVARFGGDEFCILLLEEESIRNVSKIAEEIITAIAQPILLNNKTVEVSTSVGITMIPTDGADVNSILRNADMAMYAAKNSVKGGFLFYNKSLREYAAAKSQLEDELIVAINEEQFELHYQPIVSLSTGGISGYEALIRWLHPEKGMLYPDKFIALAEETDRIIDIGYWVMKEVCHHILEHESGPHCRYRFAINLSPIQFKDPLLLQKTRDILEESKVDGRFLEFEITESCFMENVDDAVHTIQQFKAIGISVAIDDFGTGYSSFALLKKLPINKLKIDKSFIDDLETNINDQQIVQGLISMAHKLQLSVVAEGVETEVQKRLLKQYHCDSGQGYLFSKPAPMKQLRAGR